MKYEDMSDFEVNKLVAEKHLKLFVNESMSGGILNSDVWLFDSEGLVRYTNYNPCNNPSDAWPIVVSSDINLSKHKDDGHWFAFTRAEDLGVSEFRCKDNNPLRAAMICFLKMKDAEK